MISFTGIEDSILYMRNISKHKAITELILNCKRKNNMKIWFFVPLKEKQWLILRRGQQDNNLRFISNSPNTPTKEQTTVINSNSNGKFNSQLQHSAQRGYLTLENRI